ncbi:signal peptide peptidase SppA [SAR92 clade bacterium H231]|nr:signal peptide peptidase SppA [Porticoccaceae bacterium]MBT7905275.1 signal peptide peptidase SppA [Porticoccaceae bacterium]MCT2532425.1 signal peptide peptidase SppA [SAR92 clade bacterium H231]
MGIIRRIFRFVGTVISGIRTLLGVVIFGFVLIAIAGMFADNLQPIPDKGALYLAPGGFLVDQKTYTDPLEKLLSQGMESETLVRDIIEALDAAASDSRITHLLLDTDYMAGAGLSKLEEISSALVRFKQSGKPIIAVADDYGQQQYYLAAHADEILLNPLGSVLITGFASYRSYYKEALDKLRVKVHIFRVGDFKSAVEPYMGNSMSTGVKEERRAMIDELWQFYSSQIENLRGLPTGAINDYTNNLHTKLRSANGDSAMLAQQQGLVDQVASRTQMLKYLNEVIPTTDGEFNSINLKGYLSHVRREQLISAAAKEHRIALVVAKGTIMDGEQPEGSVGGDTLAGIFADLRKDENVKAVVLRVDSPGGSAFASEVIRDAMAATRAEGVPIVVSMGSVAASGGYWIATEADRVLALSTTITGSIGVYGIVPTVERSMEALGIYSDGVSTADISGIMQLDRAMTPQAEMVFQAGVDNIYTQFLALVAEARNSTPAEVHEIAQGRVWTGEQALELGLVDQLGDLNEAVKVAAELANLADYMVDYRRKPLSAYEQLLLSMSSSAGTSLANLDIETKDSWLPDLLSRQAKTLVQPLQALDNLSDPRGMYLFCDQCPQ